LKKFNLISIVIIYFLVIISACGPSKEIENNNSGNNVSKVQITERIEKSLFDDIVNKWYPLNIDSSNGGFTSEFNRDWKPTQSSQIKSIVQQARHTWATAFIYEAYPDKKIFLEYSKHGFNFLKEHMWDTVSGGFFNTCLKNGLPDPRSIFTKQSYGQAFAIYGMSQYYKISKDARALELDKKAFLWLENNAHDKKYGGYFDQLFRNGKPVFTNENKNSKSDNSTTHALKDYNSSIHIMEAFTQLYLVWPDSLVHKRLEEMFYLVRDTFTNPDGYLQLYFLEDWTLLTDEKMGKLSGGNSYFKNHFSYGHDVETAYLLLETAEVLGLGKDIKTHQIAKKLVDHSLESGWDTINGGFFDEGKVIDGKIRITSNKKCWWGQAEGLNALLMMYELYPKDKNNYYGKFLKEWNYIETYLIDKEYGDWYNNGLDTSPESKNEQKSHIWKATYHNARSLINCVKRLRKISK
jgi:cellobiose epimerase